MDRETRQDQIDRIERVINFQIEGSRSLDDKSMALARLTILLLGSLLTGVSLLLTTSPVIKPTNSGAICSFAMGTFFFHTSIVCAIISTFTSRIKYGPLSRRRIPTDYLDRSNFTGTVRSYYDIIETNSMHLERKVRWFRRSITALTGGLVYISLSLVLVITDIGEILDLGLNYAIAYEITFLCVIFAVVLIIVFRVPSPTLINEVV